MNTIPARALAAAAMLLSAASGAQALIDPTQPPLELMRAATAGAAPRTPLQSILLSSTRRGAILNGQYVPLGGRYGNATLVAISETEVTLRTGQALEVLQLYPSSSKASARPAPERKTEKTAKRP